MAEGVDLENCAVDVMTAMAAAADAVNHPLHKRHAPEPPKTKPSNEIDLVKTFVNSTGLAKTANGKQYLLAEAWQYVLALKNLSVNTLCTEDTVAGKDGHKPVTTVTCIATLYDENGKVVSSGTMTAKSSERFLKDKPAYAVYGMAQTRAISRAARNKFGYIARACGFEATPFEEIS